MVPFEVPIRFAPASTIANKFSWVLTPPLALTPISGPTVFLIKATSCAVAPPVEKPVLVFTKSAPASLEAIHALTYSSSVNKHVSIMTFKTLEPATSFNKRISSLT